MTGRFVGIDLAWGRRGRTGIAVLDDSGRLLRSTSVRTDAEIVTAIGATQRPVAAIDAPLIVPNETGMRSCERQMHEHFGRFHAGAYPSNRANPLFAPQPRGARLAGLLGWRLDPQGPPPFALEVYPHPAMVVLLGLDTVLPYKRGRGRSAATRRAAMTHLLDGMERVCGGILRLAADERWSRIRDQVDGATRPAHLNGVEDEVDAIWCAWLAWLWVREPGVLTVYGSTVDGYIVAPRSSRARSAASTPASG